MILNASPPNKRHPLALPQRPVPVRFDPTEVDEENFAVICGDPPIALVVLEPADDSCSSEAPEIRPPQYRDLASRPNSNPVACWPQFDQTRSSLCRATTIFAVGGPGVR